MNNSNLSRITFLPLLVLAVAFVCVVPDRAIAQSEEVEEILVTSTRSRRSFEASPIRVEVLGSEELNEKANMKPGDIRMPVSYTHLTLPTKA